MNTDGSKGMVFSSEILKENINNGGNKLRVLSSLYKKRENGIFLSQRHGIGTIHMKYNCL